MHLGTAVNHREHREHRENCLTECTERTERAGKDGSLREADRSMHRPASRSHSSNSLALNVRGAGAGAPSDPPFPEGSVVSVHSVSWSGAEHHAGGTEPIRAFRSVTHIRMG